MAGMRQMRRWLYRGQRPHRLARLLNRVQAWLATRGIGPRRVVALEVMGRRTGSAIRLPLVIADYDGERYLVSMFGEGAAWVRNVRAAHGMAALRHGARAPVRLEEVSPRERPPILRRYLELAPGARPHIPVAVDAPLSAFADVAAGYPVFRVVSRPDSSPVPGVP